MGDKPTFKKAEPKAREIQAFATEIPKDAARTVFRYLFSKENSLIELFPNPIIIKKSDIIDLHKRISQKVAHYDLYGTQFDAVASFENKKSVQYGSWDRFADEDWATASVLDQLLMNWRFLIKFPNTEKPASYVVSIRLASSLKPQHIMQAIFSKNPEDIDRMEIDLVPMSCRVDFVDPLLSEELLALVSEWNKCCPSPVYIFPIMKKVKKYDEIILNLLKYSVPVLSFAACTSYYWTKTRTLDFSLPASTELIVKSNIWFAGTLAILFLSAVMGFILSGYVENQLQRFGRFTIFNLTKGDDKRQTDLLARSTNSFWKFIFSGGVAVLWNVVAAILCGIFLSSK